eukprot:COSAG05_NODE_6831_length_894_cov_2.713208_1_plen_68_part_01
MTPSSPRVRPGGRIERGLRDGGRRAGPRGAADFYTHTHIKKKFAVAATRQASNAIIANLRRDLNANPC